MNTLIFKTLIDRYLAKPNSCFLILFFCLISTSSNFGQSPPQLKLTELATGLYRPTDIAAAGDNRIFISQMDGKIMIYENGVVSPTPFLDISAKIKSSEWSGIFGFTFHPNFAQNGYLYVHYLTPGNDYSVYSRFTRNANNPNLADSNSEVIIYTAPYPANGHRSGHIAFGPDGYLYIMTGDGASGAVRGAIGDPNGNSQNLKSVFGKIIRIDVNNGFPYSIPPSNPYLSPNDGIPDEIWARGLRNPWRWSFDRQTGDLWIGDNGEDGYEEVDFLPNTYGAGANFGWRCYEATHPYVGTGCGAISTFTMPIIEYPGYDHNNQVGASVLGGFVYRGNQFESLKGWYVYGDWTLGKFWTLKKQANGSYQNVLQNITLQNAVSFGEDAQGELYTATFFDGKFYKIGLNIMETVQSGDWQNPNTWACHCIPTSTDEILIKSNHQVSINQSVIVKSLKIDGDLKYINNAIVLIQN